VRQGQLDLAGLDDGKPLEDHTGLQWKLVGTTTNTLQLVYGLLKQGAIAHLEA